MNDTAVQRADLRQPVRPVIDVRAATKVYVSRPNEPGPRPIH
jgi:hypothetical protein